jgi:hypothetical protein
VSVHVPRIAARISQWCVLSECEDAAVLLASSVDVVSAGAEGEWVPAERDQRARGWVTETSNLLDLAVSRAERRSWSSATMSDGAGGVVSAGRLPCYP